MASIGKDPGGRKRILFVAPDGRRKTIRLGKLSIRAAEGVKYRVEHLLSSKIAGHAVEADTAQWVASLEPTLAEKLAAAGLIPRPEIATLGEFINSYINGRNDAKSGTIDHLRRVRTDLVNFFGADKPMGEVTVGDADNFRRDLIGRGLASNTVRRRCGRAKQFWNVAIDHELITRNPFVKQKVTVGANRERDYFLSREDSQKILEACPDGQWRLIFALSRFGGLRCPSEHLALTWEDVDWSRQRLLVTSPKTAHHEGKGERWIPIFPELKPHLEAAFEQAEEGESRIITRYTNAKQNLRTQFERIIKRAGLIPWEKLFQNLRLSRATELANEFPAHVAAEWLGHSAMVAVKHYWRTTDDDYEKATLEKPPAGCAAQKAAQQAHVKGRNGSQEEIPESGKPLVLQGIATPCDTIQVYIAPPARLELATRRLTAACSTN